MPNDDWTTRPIYVPIAKAIDELIDSGFAEPAIADAVISVGVSLAQHLRGPRFLAERFRLMAEKFEADANAIELAKIEAGNAPMH